MTAPQPLIEQRADPFIHKHTDGYYYFTASVPTYDGIELRRAKTIAGLAQAAPVMVWYKPDKGPTSELIWAPELHFINGLWVVYFAAAPQRDVRDEHSHHLMYALTSEAANPLLGPWAKPRRIDSGWDSFSLDATTFEHRGIRYYTWAQQDHNILGNSNLYLAPMDSPISLAGPAVRLSIPEYDWEIRGYRVNEGPAVIKHESRLFMTYSASATDENYAVGILWADQDSDLLAPASWTKSKEPALVSDSSRGIFGPGHNSFTVAEDGVTDLLVYHARTTREINGDPLWDPNRHTFVKPVEWEANDMPIFMAM